MARRALPEGLVESTLKTLDIEIIDIRGGELYALCPGHKRITGKPDHNPSWSINEETGAHFCFSCGYRGSLLSLIRDMKGDDAATQMWTGYEEHGRPVTEDPVKVSVTVPTVRSANDALPESTVLMFSDPPGWALSRRRILAAGVKEYGIRWNEKRETWILPLRYPDSLELMGYQEKAEKSRYFRNRPVSMPKSKTLFGIDVVREDKKIVVVESPLDAVLLADMGYGAVAICGSVMSTEQVALLRNFDQIFLWLDDDTAGKKETKRLRKYLPAQGVRATLVPSVGGWKDPGEMPYGAIDEAMSRAKF